jgi:oligogalacturonide transporter
MNETSEKKIPTWRLFFYGLGDSFGGGSQMMVTLLYLVFLTDVMQISPGLAGTIFLISRIYDAITDPFEGIIGDRTRTKLGRRKPYLIIGIPLIIISLTLLFTPVGFESEGARFAFALGMFLIYSTTNSLVMLNYHALASEMVQDYHERTKLRAFQGLASTVAVLLINMVPLQIINTVPDVNKAYTLAGLVGGLILSVGTISAAIVGKERPELRREAPKGFNFKTDILQPLQNKTYMAWVGMILFYFTANVIPTTLTIYFMRDFLGRASEAGTLMSVGIIGFFLSLVVGPILSKKWGKKKTFIWATIFMILTRLLLFFVMPGQPAIIIYIIYVVNGVFSGIANLVMFAMLPDMPDVDELASGKRREGIYMSLQQLARKTADGIAVYLAANLIGLIGYVAPLQEVVDGVTTLVQQQQPDSFLLGLRLLFILGPLFFNVLSLICAYLLKLTPELYDEVKAILVKRRAGVALEEEEEKRASELKSYLVGDKW